MRKYTLLYSRENSLPTQFLILIDGMLKWLRR